MKVRLLQVIALCYIASTVQSTSNGSFEHQVRADLLTDYDKAVFPSLGKKVLGIEFGMRINKLVKVDNKEQLLTIDTWIVMKWNNTFLAWDTNKFGGANTVHFKPSEIWFPDIQLYNNGDTQTQRAGGRDKFLSDVQVKSSGECIWSGPATFMASCSMKLSTYPFDKQTCELRFGSYSYGDNKVMIRAFKTRKDTAEQYIESGDWELGWVKVNTGKTDHGDCCPYEFNQISYTVQLTRRYQYHLFYLVAPCGLLSALSLLSFCIPTESGERIGFVTTLLLGMMVFLLLIPQSLPESSLSIPILGILMMVTMIMIAVILFVTILILKCFYSKRKPPRFLHNSLSRTKSHKKIAKSAHGLDNIALRAVAPSNESISRASSSTAFREQKEMDNEATWQAFARLCDKILFVVFFIFTGVMYAITMTYRD